MIKLTDEMRNLIDPALANGCPCILASVGARWLTPWCYGIDRRLDVDVAGIHVKGA